MLPEGEEDDEKQKKVTSITSAGNFCYALVKGKSEVYSWGFGENYVLGNRDDANEYKPYKLDPRMFEEKQVIQISCGTQHVVALVQDTAEVPMPNFDHGSFVKVATQLPPKEPKPVAEEGAEGDDDDEDIVELPEFSKSLSMSKTASVREKPKSNAPAVNGNQVDKSMNVTEPASARG